MYKVLVADDEKPLRMLIAGTLEMGDYSIIEAEDGNEAWELVKTEKPDLVLLDVMMPKMTGYEVCKKIKSDPDTRDITVLILTAKGQLADQEAAWDARADFYLAKPFSPAELLEMIEGIFREKVGD